MEIAALLREEREALVARIAKIDKMLRQHDDWGREAQRLLSLTVAAESTPPDEHPANGSTKIDAHPTASTEPKYRDVSGLRVRVRSRTFPESASAKTPIPEFEAAVIDVLRAANRPMDRVALYEALTARGIVIGDGGRDKDLNALSARVYRMAQDPANRISSLRGQGYWLETDDPAVGPMSEGEDDGQSDDMI